MFKRHGIALREQTLNLVIVNKWENNIIMILNVSVISVVYYEIVLGFVNCNIF